jgi:histidinol-phosphate aminotransferase
VNDRAPKPVPDAIVAATAAEVVAAVVREDVRALKAYVVADAAGMVKLDANESAFPPPADAHARALRALAAVDMHRYPDGPARAAHAALRRMLDLDPATGLVLGNGSDELISLIIQLVARPGACVMAPEPTFVMYAVSARHAGVRFQGVPLRADFTLDLPAMLAAIERERPSVIFIASPNNPTGVRYPDGQLEAILRAAPGLVVIDEAYAAFADSAWLPRATAYPNLLVMATLSKIGMAGLRLGYAVGAPAWIAELEKLRPPYNVNSLTQAAAVELLAQPDWIGERAIAIRRERERLASRLKQLPGVTVVPSQANFLLVRVAQAARVAEALKARRVLVKQVAAMHASLADCLRITVGTPEENDMLMKNLTELCQESRP